MNRSKRTDRLNTKDLISRKLDKDQKLKKNRIRI